VNVSDRTQEHFKEVDAMSPEMRACVHEFGYSIVAAFAQFGIRNPTAIREITRACWEGPRSPRQRRPVNGTLDWLLVQSGAQINAAQLCRVLRMNSLLIVPQTPTKSMIDASMNEVKNHGTLCSKHDKHRIRLVAALAAGADYFEGVRREASVA
jgi:hypothetical protein